MKIYPLLFLVLFITIHPTKAQVGEKPIYTAPKWENPEIFQINREKPTATFYRYDNASSALQNNSWSPSGLAHDQYRVKAGNLEYSYKILPIR